MREKIVFFVVFCLLLGTLGITIPGVDYYLKEGKIPIDDISIGLITIVVSTIGYSAANIIIKSNDKLDLLFNVCALTLSIVSTVFIVIFLSNNRGDISIWVSVVVYLLSLCFWWYQNRNEFIIDPENSLGGKIKEN